MTKSNSFKWIWVAKKPCGCIIAAHVDNQNDQELKDDIYQWLKEGLIVTLESGRVTLGLCSEHGKY